MNQIAFLFLSFSPCPSLAALDGKNDTKQVSLNSGSGYVGYVSDPDGRGTPSLVISCVVTLTLCVWSALHLNVPSQNQTRVQEVLLNLRWIIAGIYAPELVVFTAWRQWCSARLLQKLVDGSLKPDSTTARQDGRPLQWTMAHSFFACTGGFALELDELANITAPGSDNEMTRPRRLTITARGMVVLAQCGHLPRVDKAEIEDKSKANDLAKATVIIQATWMVVQLIGRLAFRLPVTLLEVNTVAHVLCAFAMYMFWWNKPLLPNEPIILRNPELAPFAAFMYSSSEMSGYINPAGVRSQTWVKTLFAYLSVYSKSPEMESICLRADTHETKPGLLTVQEEEVTEAKTATTRVRPLVVSMRSESGIFQRAPSSCIRDIQAQREKDQGTAFFERRPRVVEARPANSQESAADLKRWGLVQTALHEHPSLFEHRVLMAHSVDGKRCVHLRPEQLVADHIQNWPSNDLLRDVGGLVVGIVLWLANFCYGGIHAAAWNDHFPSEAEKWLWRASASYTGFCGGLWVVLNFVVSRSPFLNEFWEHWMDGKKSWLESIVLGVVVFICGFSLMLARVYIIVEAFCSIRELPVSAYQTPEWTAVFPHF